MKKVEYDIFVIGSGVAGKTVAEECNEKGLKVAIAEDLEFGGTCANRGCDPKKVLLGPTEIIQQANDLKKKGIKKTPKISWKKLQKFKRTFTKNVPLNTKDYFEEKGIKMYAESPKFVGMNTLKVGGLEVHAKNIVIATGLHTRKLKLKGAEFVKDSSDFLSMKKLSKKSHLSRCGIYRYGICPHGRQGR